VFADLERIAAEFNDAAARAHRLAESVSDAAWLAPPPKGGWSIGECVAHLTLTNERYIPILAESADAAPFHGEDDDAPVKPMKRDLTGWLLTKMMEPPVRFRMRTAPAFIPGGSEPRARGLAAFDASQSALLHQVEALDGMDLTTLRVISPFNASLRYSVWSALHILAAHQRRHLWQAEQLRDKLRKQGIT
jgi:hypothetical protein